MADTEQVAADVGETENGKPAEETETCNDSADTTEATDLEKRIIRQVEYYFGNINLPKDRFLQEAIKEDEGWVPLETMTKFNRLKQMTQDCAAIAAALKKSKSGLIEINADSTKIRRSPSKVLPVDTPERRQELNSRTVYVKVFPIDITLDKLFEFFEKYGQMDNIFMRRDQKKKFKGSVFATFDKDEDFKKFLAEESVKYEEQELIKKSKEVYFKDKEIERKDRKEEQQKKKQKADEKHEGEQKKQFENKITKGAIMHLKGFTDETTREDIRNLLQDHGLIAWVDFSKGDTEGWVRYDEEGKATEVLEKVNAAMDNNITLDGNKLEARVLEGEEELAQWQKMYRDMADKRNRSKPKYHSGKKYGKRPSKGTRDRAKAEGGEEDGEPPKKQAKVEGD